MNNILSSKIGLASIIILLFLIIGIVIYLIIRRRYAYEDLSGTEFEEYCADYLWDMGFNKVEVTKASRDFGCDILAVKDQVTYGIQCKYYDRPVGVSAVQQVYAGKDYYGKMIGVVMTNSEFTKPARDMADKLNVLLWDKIE